MTQDRKHGGDPPEDEDLPIPTRIWWPCSRSDTRFCISMEESVSRGIVDWTGRVMENKGSVVTLSSI